MYVPIYIYKIKSSFVLCTHNIIFPKIITGSSKSTDPMSSYNIMRNETYENEIVRSQ